MTPRSKKRLVNFLRIALCFGAMWIVIQGVTLQDVVHLQGGEVVTGRVVDDADPVRVRLANGDVVDLSREELLLDEQGDPRINFGLLTAWQNMHGGLFALAVAIYFPIVFFQALRIQWLLKAQQISLGYWDATKLSIAGNFLNFATPLGSNAGDVFKAYFLSLHTDRKTEAVTTVFLDRVIGLATLLSVVALITVLSPSDSRLAVVRPYMLGMVGIGLLVVFAYFAPPLRRKLLPRKWLERLPAFEQLQRVDRTAHSLAAHRWIVLGAVLLTVVLQAIAVVAYFTIAMSLGLHTTLGNFFEYYTYFCTGVLVQSLPGPPQGLGTVELTYKYFLAPFGSPAQIVCVAFAVRLMVLLCALPGLLVTLTGSYRPRPAAEPTADDPPFTTLEPAVAVSGPSRPAEPGR